MSEQEHKVVFFPRPARLVRLEDRTPLVLAGRAVPRAYLLSKQGESDDAN